MDILLNASGDVLISHDGDIIICNSVAQKIRIKLLWFESEWRWDADEGIPYFDFFVKNPNIDYLESIIREKIFEVEEVTEVEEVKVIYDSKKRVAKIKYIALTDGETINEEVEIFVKVRSDG